MVKKIFNKKIFLIYFVLAYMNIPTFFAAIKFKPLGNEILKKKVVEENKDANNQNNNQSNNQNDINSEKNDNKNCSDLILSGNIPENEENNIINTSKKKEDSGNNGYINLNKSCEVSDDDEDYDENDDETNNKKNAKMILWRYILVSFFLYHGYFYEADALKKYNVEFNEDNLYSVYFDYVGARNSDHSTYVYLSEFFKKMFAYYDDEEKKFLPFEKKEVVDKKTNKTKIEYEKKDLKYGACMQQFLQYIQTKDKSFLSEKECQTVFNYLENNVKDSDKNISVLWVFALFLGYYVFKCVLETIIVPKIEHDINIDPSSPVLESLKRQFYLKRLHEELSKKYKLYMQYLHEIITKFSTQKARLEELILAHRENCICNKYFWTYFTNIHYRPLKSENSGGNYMDCMGQYIRDQK